MLPSELHHVCDAASRANLLASTTLCVQHGRCIQPIDAAGTELLSVHVREQGILYKASYSEIMYR